MVHRDRVHGHSTVHHWNRVQAVVYPAISDARQRLVHGRVLQPLPFPERSPYPGGTQSGRPARGALSALAVNEIFSWLDVLLGMIIHAGNVLLSLWIFLSVVFIVFFNFLVVDHLFLLWIVSRTPEGKAVDEIYIHGILLSTLFTSFMIDSIRMILSSAIVIRLARPHGPNLAATLVD